MPLLKLLGMIAYFAGLIGVLWFFLTAPPYPRRRYLVLTAVALIVGFMVMVST